MKTLQKIFRRFLKSNRGFTLVEVMIAAGVMGGLGLVMMEITKQQSTQNVDYQITADVAQMKADIQSLFSSPANCYANFIGYSNVTTAHSALMRCTGSAACRFNTGSGATPQIYVNNSTWTNTGSASNRVRLSSFTSTVYAPVIPTGMTQILTYATLNVTFQKKTMKTIKSENFAFNIPVIANASYIVGCPQSWNSTVPY